MKIWQNSYMRNLNIYSGNSNGFTYFFLPHEFAHFLKHLFVVTHKLSALEVNLCHGIHISQQDGHPQVQHYSLGFYKERINRESVCVCVCGAWWVFHDPRESCLLHLMWFLCRPAVPLSNTPWTHTHHSRKLRHAAPELIICVTTCEELKQQLPNCPNYFDSISQPLSSARTASLGVSRVMTLFVPGRERIGKAVTADDVDGQH